MLGDNSLTSVHHVAVKNKTSVQLNVKKVNDKQFEYSLKSY